MLYSVSAGYEDNNNDMSFLRHDAVQCVGLVGG